MRSIAANKILIDKDTIITNHYILINEDGEVLSIKPLALCQVEPSRTLFYNGLITTYISEDERKLNQEIKLLITQSLEAGYKGKLLLWQNLSLSELKIKVDTKVKEL